MSDTQRATVEYRGVAPCDRPTCINCANRGQCLDARNAKKVLPRSKTQCMKHLATCVYVMMGVVLRQSGTLPRCVPLSCSHGRSVVRAVSKKIIEVRIENKQSRFSDLIPRLNSVIFGDRCRSRITIPIADRRWVIFRVINKSVPKSWRWKPQTVEIYIIRRSISYVGSWQVQRSRVGRFEFTIIENRQRKSERVLHSYLKALPTL